MTGPKRTTRIVFGYTAENRVAGETHPKATLSDHDVDLIRELHEGHLNVVTGQWMPGLGYKKIAQKFGVHRNTVRDIVLCRRRYAIVIKLLSLRESKP